MLRNSKGHCICQLSKYYACMYVYVSSTNNHKNIFIIISELQKHASCLAKIKVSHGASPAYLRTEVTDELEVEQSQHDRFTASVCLNNTQTDTHRRTDRHTQI